MWFCFALADLFCILLNLKDNYYPPPFFSWALSLPSLLFVNNLLLLTLSANSNVQYFLCMETSFRHDILFSFFLIFELRRKDSKGTRRSGGKEVWPFVKLSTDRPVDHHLGHPFFSCMGFFPGPRKSSHMRQTGNQEDWEFQRNTGRGRRRSSDLQASWPSH